MPMGKMWESFKKSIKEKLPSSLGGDVPNCVDVMKQKGYSVSEAEEVCAGASAITKEQEKAISEKKKKQAKGEY